MFNSICGGEMQLNSLIQKNLTFSLLIFFMAALAMLPEYWFEPKITNFTKHILWAYVFLPFAAAYFNISIMGKIGKIKAFLSIFCVLLYFAIEYLVILFFLSVRIRLGLGI